MYELKAEVRESLINEMMEVLTHYRWHPTRIGCERIVDDWFKSKEHLIDKFSKLPNWVDDKFMIVFSTDYTKPIDCNAIRTVCSNMRYELDDNPSKYLVHNTELDKYPFTYKEVDKICCQYSDIYSLITKTNISVTANGYGRNDVQEVENEYRRYSKMRTVIGNIPEYTEESKEIRRAVYEMLYWIYDTCTSENFSSVLTEDMAETFNAYRERAGIKGNFVAGQRIMKVIRKFFVAVGLDTKASDYNSWIAKLGDAVNELHYTRHTVFSFNLIDFLRSSMGTSWSSCHTIDRANVDDRDGDSYQGMHAKGNLSYMLDGVTGILYTVHTEYDGRDFELQDKVTRQLYHFGNGDDNQQFFIQGRLYPQSNDYGAQSLYKQNREIIQKMLSEAWEVDNLWAAPIESERNSAYYRSEGSHYRDYANFDSCKISRIKGKTDFKQITIGAQELCIECGKPHYGDNDELSCCSNFTGYECYECGSVNNGNYHEINGDYYCEECCFYCEYHEEWELYPEDRIHVEDYGDICERAFDYGNFFSCDRCGDAYLYDDCECIRTADGNTYCCEDCAERDGYEYAVDAEEWVYQPRHCAECGEAYANDDDNMMYDEETDKWYCLACYETLINNRREEEGDDYEEAV